MKAYEPNFKRLDELTEEGYLRKVISPCGRLMLYNYSDKTTYEGKWNKHTLNARGTVYEIATGKVIARAFPKFFNFSELQPVKQKTILKSKSFQTFEKMDGSLGIVYYYDGEWRVNTRGSFTSDQAIKGKQILDEKYDMKQVSKEDTLLVEIIYPDNKIIVDYGNEEKLVLLASFDGFSDTADWTNVISEYSHMPKAPSSTFSSIEELQDHLATLDHTEEGYVVRLEDGTRVKFKSRAYLDVARLKGNMTPLAFWKCLSNGSVKCDFLEHLPEEFRKEADDLMILIETKYLGQKMRLIEEFNYAIKSIGGIDQYDVKKKLGIFMKTENLKYPQAMFPMLLKKSEAVDKIILKLIRPKGNLL